MPKGVMAGEDFNEGSLYLLKKLLKSYYFIMLIYLHVYFLSITYY